MPRTSGIAAALALTTVLCLGTSCGYRDPDAQQRDADMQLLPVDTIGVVTIGSSSLPMPQNARTVVATFNDHGDEVGRVSGDAISSATTITWGHGFTTATADSVITLTDTGNSRVSIDENMIEGAISNPRADGALFWFNTAQPDGPTVPYRNNYVMTSADNEPTVRSVPGIMLTAGHCGGSAYGVVVTYEEMTAGKPDARHLLYEMTSDGDPTVRGEWVSPVDFSAFSRTSACSVDGTALYNIYGSPAALRDETGGSELSLVRIDTGTGARTETPIEMAGHSGMSEPNSLTLVDDRLYWISSDGSMLSFPVDGTEGTVREEWRVPRLGKHHKEAVSGTVVASLDYEDTPSYAEFDIRTGHRVKGPVELPWLTEILKDHESITVMNISSVPGE